MNAKFIMIGLASVVLLMPLGSVNGQDWGYGSSSNGWGFGWPTGCGTGDTIPYFSLFPPVYYSYHVPRPYGYSPFAYPPGVFTPSYGMLAVAGRNTSAAAPDSSARQGRPPLKIDNPYVQHSANPGTAISHSPPVRQPKVVYPATMARRAGGPSGGS
jgi:hypothetical protein